MNFRNILQEIEKADPDVYERLSGRRHALKSFGSKVALAALPLAVGSLFKKAYGKTSATSAVANALNFALELEYLEYNFYFEANNTGGLIPSTDLPGFQTIQAHVLEHINFLTAAITALGVVPYTPPNYNASANNPAYIPSGTYDFTAGSVYKTFSDYNTFLVLAQTFEDTGVRAYKGQIPVFYGSATVLQQALEISCVEARHAAHVRLVRRNTGAAAPDYPAPWITNNIPPIAALQANYTGEDNVDQQGVVITSLPDITGTIPEASATAAFDEPLDQPTVTQLISPFFVL